VSDRLISEIRGVTEPRIHSKLNDLPSRGQEMIDFCREIGFPLLPWQEFVAINSLKVKENGRWAYPLNGLLIARQSGKTTFMILRILAGAMLYGDDLQIGTAHTISTARESFKRLVDIVEASKLAGEVKKIRWANGEQEIQFMNGARYIYRASNNATRGISKPEAIHLDELREYKNEATWASIRYTLQAARNPQTWIYSNAGDASSVILNSLRDRALASLSGSGDDIGWWEYSAHPDTPIDGSLKMWEGLAQANPSLGYTIHPENLKMALNDPPDTIRTEMLCQWVTTLNGAVDPDQWETCRDEKIVLDPQKTTWLGIDLSPSRQEAALVAAQKLDGDRFGVVLLQTWKSDLALDDKALANDIAPWVRKYQVETLAYSKQTASAIAVRLMPAGIPVHDVDGNDYMQACDEWSGAINSGRFRHSGQEEFTKQVLSAVKYQRGDSSWVIGRRASSATVCAAVASALVTHFATRVDDGIDIVVG
jgi:hypothetical protein